MYPSENDLNVYRTDGAIPHAMRDITNKSFLTILGESSAQSRNFQYLALVEEEMPDSVVIRGTSITK